MSITHILAIETSCDETAISVVRAESGNVTVLSNVVSSQIKLHAAWGGVVPNLAAREHVKNLPHVLQNALGEAQISPAKIDLIAVTNGPGLIPALLTGVNFAKTLAYLWEKPLLGIHHIEGHIYANFIRGISNDKFRILKQDEKNNSSLIQNSKFKIQNLPNIKFPILCLVVSGGHTQLVLMKDHLKYEIIGQTLDDAVGEAFDKVARILDIGYPGGPVVAACAAEFRISNFEFRRESDSEIQNSKIEIHLPRPMLNKPGFNFSFSGLKTAVLYETKKNPALLKDTKYIAEICHEFQQAAIDVLIRKTIKAAEKHKPKTIMLAGGVSANEELRKQLGEAIEKKLSAVNYRIPDIEFTGDNAAMIAAAAAFRWEKMSATQKKKTLQNWKTLQTDANLKMK